MWRRVTELGRRTRDWRFERRLLLYEMAERLGISAAELAVYETGRRPWPDEVRTRAEAILADMG